MLFRDTANESRSSESRSSYTDESRQGGVTYTRILISAYSPMTMVRSAIRKALQGVKRNGTRVVGRTVLEKEACVRALARGIKSRMVLVVGCSMSRRQLRRLGRPFGA